MKNVTLFVDGTLECIDDSNDSFIGRQRDSSITWFANDGSSILYRPRSGEPPSTSIHRAFKLAGGVCIPDGHAFTILAPEDTPSMLTSRRKTLRVSGWMVLPEAETNVVVVEGSCGIELNPRVRLSLSTMEFAAEFPVRDPGEKDVSITRAGAFVSYRYFEHKERGSIFTCRRAFFLRPLLMAVEAALSRRSRDDSSFSRLLRVRDMLTVLASETGEEVILPVAQEVDPLSHSDYRDLISPVYRSPARSVAVCTELWPSLGATIYLPCCPGPVHIALGDSEYLVSSDNSCMFWKRFHGDTAETISLEYPPMDSDFISRVFLMRRAAQLAQHNTDTSKQPSVSTTLACEERESYLEGIGTLSVSQGGFVAGKFLDRTLLTFQLAKDGRIDRLCGFLRVLDPKGNFKEYLWESALELDHLKCYVNVILAFLSGSDTRLDKTPAISQIEREKIERLLVTQAISLRN